PVNHYRVSRCDQEEWPLGIAHALAVASGCHCVGVWRGHRISRNGCCDSFVCGVILLQSPTHHTATRTRFAFCTRTKNPKISFSRICRIALDGLPGHSALCVNPLHTLTSTLP